MIENFEKSDRFPRQFSGLGIHGAGTLSKDHFKSAVHKSQFSPGRPPASQRDVNQWRWCSPGKYNSSERKCRTNIDLDSANHQRVGSDGDLADNAEEEEMLHTSETNGAESCKEKDVTRGFSGCQTVLGYRNDGRLFWVRV